MVVERTKMWTKARDDYLKRYYSPKCHVDPAMLSMSLGIKVNCIINRLSELGLRNRRLTHYEQRSYYKKVERRTA